MNFTNLKNKLADIGGSKKNIASFFWNEIPKESSEDDIKNALGHWPENAITMIGLNGLNNIEEIMNIILNENIQGDILEAGVWRGGASIFIKKILQSYNDNTKKIFVCDSFEGLPKPQSDRYQHFAEVEDTHYLKNSYLGVSLETVKTNFEEYNALDDNVVFLKGWFNNTLNNTDIKDLALLRMDGDMYSSTMDILNNLYNKVVPGGFIIIDDYGLGCCKLAIHDFFNSKNINIQEKLKMVNHAIAYFRK